jgi:hypothetical protein
MVVGMLRTPSKVVVMVYLQATLNWSPTSVGVEWLLVMRILAWTLCNRWDRKWGFCLLELFIDDGVMSLEKLIAEVF